MWVFVVSSVWVRLLGLGLIFRILVLLRLLGIVVICVSNCMLNRKFWFSVLLVFRL